MAFGFYEGLRRAYPSSRISLLCPEGSAGLEPAHVFDSVQTLSRADREFPAGVARFARHLRPQHYDLGVTLPASLSAAFLLFASGARQRVGFASDGSALLLNASLRWKGRDSGRHKARLYLDLLEWMTAQRFSSASFPEDKGNRERLVVIAPGASIALRVWPYYKELIGSLREAHPSFRIAVIGSPNEEAWHETLRGFSDPGIEDWIGRTSLNELVSVFQKAALVITNDSGPAHLAATLAHAPTLVLFGPGDPAYIRPLGPRVIEKRVTQLPCSPCEKPYCLAPFGYQRCLVDLSMEEVLREAGRVLSL